MCEVRNIYQKSVVEIGIDVEQREEVEIPIQMVREILHVLSRILDIDLVNFLGRTFAEALLENMTNIFLARGVYKDAPLNYL